MSYLDELWKKHSKPSVQMPPCMMVDVDKFKNAVTEALQKQRESDYEVMLKTLCELFGLEEGVLLNIPKLKEVILNNKLEEEG